jgi:hypothetical protein
MTDDNVIYVKDQTLNKTQWFLKQITNVNIATIALLISVTVITSQIKNTLNDLSIKNGEAIAISNAMTLLLAQSTDLIKKIDYFNLNYQTYNYNLQMANSNGLDTLLRRGLTMDTGYNGFVGLDSCSGGQFKTPSTLNLTKGNWLCVSDLSINLNSKNVDSILLFLCDEDGSYISDGFASVFTKTAATYSVTQSGYVRAVDFVEVSDAGRQIRIYASVCKTGGTGVASRIRCLQYR